MRFDVDEWFDRFEGGPEVIGELLDPELAALLVFLAGGTAGGIALLLGWPLIPAALVGAGVAAVAFVAYWVRVLVLWVRWWRRDSDADSTP